MSECRLLNLAFILNKLLTAKLHSYINLPPCYVCNRGVYIYISVFIFCLIIEISVYFFFFLILGLNPILH